MKPDTKITIQKRGKILKTPAKPSTKSDTKRTDTKKKKKKKLESNPSKTLSENLKPRIRELLGDKRTQHLVRIFVKLIRGNQ
jgi:hypothetical protein